MQPRNVYHIKNDLVRSLIGMDMLTNERWQSIEDKEAKLNGKWKGKKKKNKRFKKNSKTDKSYPQFID